MTAKIAKEDWGAFLRRKATYLRECASEMEELAIWMDEVGAKKE